jgi:general secretion pathway protein B
MSYLFNALKQSEKTESSEHSHLAYQHQKQLNFYRRLSFGLGGIVFFGGALAAGFVAGKFFQASTSPRIQQPEVVVENSAREKQSSLHAVEKSERTTQPSVVPNPVENVMNNTSTLVNQPVTYEPQPIQYQWASVQIGVDVSGQPVYEQRLVPVNHQQSAGIQVVPSQPLSQSRTVVPGGTQSNIARADTVGQPNLAQSQLTPPNLIDQNRVTVNANNQYQPSNSTEKNTVKPYSDPELENVSDELKEAFAQAVADTEDKPSLDIIATSKDSAKATPIELLPAGLQNSIPRLRYQAHIYATEADKRWIKLNNRELYEGDSIGALRLLEITPEQALFNFDGYEFTLKAMQDWPL